MKIVSGTRRLENGERERWGGGESKGWSHQSTKGLCNDKLSTKNFQIMDSFYPFSLAATYSTGTRSVSIIWPVFGRLSTGRTLIKKGLNTTGLCMKAKCPTQGLDRWVFPLESGIWSCFKWQGGNHIAWHFCVYSVLCWLRWGCWD